MNRKNLALLILLGAMVGASAKMKLMTQHCAERTAQRNYGGMPKQDVRGLEVRTMQFEHTHTGQAAQRALQKAFNAEVALIREGGSIPIVSDFRNILGVETLLLGLALPGCRAHSPNENFPLENLDAGIRMNKAVLEELAA